MNQLLSLPAFYKIFLYGRWSQESEIEDDTDQNFRRLIQQIANVTNPVKYTTCDINLNNEVGDGKPKGYLITASEEEGDCEYMLLSDIMALIEDIRLHAQNMSCLKSTTIENFQWINKTAYIELSCR